MFAKRLALAVKRMNSYKYGLRILMLAHANLLACFSSQGSELFVNMT